MAPAKSAWQVAPVTPMGNGTSSSYNHGPYQPVASLEGNSPFDADNATDAANASDAATLAPQAATSAADNLDQLILVRTNPCRLGPGQSKFHPPLTWRA